MDLVFGDEVYFYLTNYLNDIFMCFQQFFCKNVL